MKGELVSFETSDRLVLPGMIFEPVRHSKKVALFLHGNGSSSVFYSTERMNVFAEEFAKHGIAFFMFNNRGAHYVKSFYQEKGKTEERVEYGMTFEFIEECVKDIDGAIEFLKERGYRTFFLIGHSTGANKICVFNYMKPRNIIAAYVLLAGGDDTGGYYAKLGARKFSSLIKKCKEMIQKGKGRNLVPSMRWISYQSLHDTINPDGRYNVFPFYESLHGGKLSKKKPLFEEYGSIKIPTLVIYGDHDEYCYGRVPECIDMLKKACSVPQKFSFLIMKNADHGFYGKEKKLGVVVAAWCAKNA